MVSPCLDELLDVPASPDQLAGARVGLGLREGTRLDDGRQGVTGPVLRIGSHCHNRGFNNWFWREGELEPRFERALGVAKAEREAEAIDGPFGPPIKKQRGGKGGVAGDERDAERVAKAEREARELTGPNGLDKSRPKKRHDINTGVGRGKGGGGSKPEAGSDAQIAKL